MAKDIEKAVARSNQANASGTKKGNSRSLSVGFKKSFTAPEQVEIKTKRREMRARLTAAG